MNDHTRQGHVGARRVFRLTGHPGHPGHLTLAMMPLEMINRWIWLVPS